MFCSNCGENFPEDARFCKHCGAAVQPDSDNDTTQGKLLTRTPTLSPREQVLDTRLAWLVIAGGVIVAAGSLMPWVSVTTILGSINRSAWQLGSGLSDDGTGPLLLIFGLLLASVGWAMLGGRARWFGHKRTGIVIEVILLLILILIFKPLIDFANQGGTKYAVGSIGIGYWISGVGTVVALVGSIKFPKVSSAESGEATEVSQWCDNCEKEFDGNVEFCPECGGKAQAERGETAMKTKIVIAALTVLALAAATGFGIAEDKLGVVQPQLTNARITINSDAAQLKNDAAQLKSDQTQLTHDNSVISAANEIPPGGYGAFQTSMISSLVSKGDTPAGSSLNCVLPTSWTAGETFSCDAFNSAGSHTGIANITVESPSPNGSTAWQYTWSAGP